MVTLTETAAAMVRDIQAKGEPHYLRVTVKSGGPTGFLYDLKLDDKVNVTDDYLGKSHGIEILVDRQSSIFLEGATIDFGPRDGERGFIFDNPNAATQ